MRTAFPVTPTTTTTGVYHEDGQDHEVSLADCEVSYGRLVVWLDRELDLTPAEEAALLDMFEEAAEEVLASQAVPVAIARLQVKLACVWPGLYEDDQEFASNQEGWSDALEFALHLLGASPLDTTASAYVMACHQHLEAADFDALEAELVAQLASGEAVDVPALADAWATTKLATELDEYQETIEQLLS